MIDYIFVCTDTECDNFQKPVTITSEMLFADGQHSSTAYYLTPNVICECGKEAVRLKKA